MMMPVATVHVGCATLVTGAGGVPAIGLIITLADAAEVQPTALVTVKL